jgi:hypothetical protein
MQYFGSPDDMKLQARFLRRYSRSRQAARITRFSACSIGDATGGRTSKRSLSSLDPFRTSVERRTRPHI